MDQIIELKTRFVAMAIEANELDLANMIAAAEASDFLVIFVAEPGSIAQYLNWAATKNPDSIDEQVFLCANAIDTAIRNNLIEPELSVEVLAAMVGSFAAFVTFELSESQGE